MQILYFLISTAICFQIKTIIKPNLKLYNSHNRNDNKFNHYLSLITL
jgi:hypothetical protein